MDTTFRSNVNNLRGVENKQKGTKNGTLMDTKKMLKHLKELAPRHTECEVCNPEMSRFNY